MQIRHMFRWTESVRKLFASDLAADVEQLRSELMNLRQDFRRHDHGATYTAATTRINGSDDTISGTMATNLVTTMRTRV